MALWVGFMGSTDFKLFSPIRRNPINSINDFCVRPL
jgi:hypothetical protein